MKYSVLVICLLYITLSSGQEAKPNVNGKTPKLFFVSSSSTTSTFSTTTLCYSSIANAAVVACGRKKRAILDEDLGFSEQTNIESDSVHEDIVSGMDEATSSESRQGKFLLYWLTTTSTSTLTSYTGTTTLVVSCLPSGMSAC